MQIPIKIDTHDRGLSYHLLGSTTCQQGDEIIVSDEVTVTYQGTIVRKAIDFPETIELMVSILPPFSSGVAAGVLANWIYGKLKGKKIARLRVSRKEVEFDKGQIKRIIEETIEADGD